MRFQLIVKGTATEAVASAEQHGCTNATVQKEGANDVILKVDHESEEAIYRWFAEDGPNEVPFPIGALLWHSKLHQTDKRRKVEEQEFL